MKYEDCNVLVLNTAAYHGIAEDAKNEIEHGRISDATLGLLEKALAKSPPKSTNILLCHHHPIKAEVSDHNLVGQTRGGEKLIELLGQSTNSWVVIHGHKHTPDLFYGHGGAVNAPVVLGSASFSAQVNSDAQNKNPNQVHLLVTDAATAQNLGLTSAGTVMSWTFQPGVGWKRARNGQGLPYVSGYGYKNSVETLAADLEKHINGLTQKHITWAEAVKVAPNVLRLVPSDFVVFRNALSNKGLTILSDDNGEFAQLGRRP